MKAIKGSINNPLAWIFLFMEYSYKKLQSGNMLATTVCCVLYIMGILSTCIPLVYRPTS